MKRVTVKFLMPLVLLAISRGVSAQALVYVDCEVDDPPSLVAAITRFYDSLGSGAKPVIFLDNWIWNGEDPATHRIIVGYPDYAAMEAFRRRIAGSAEGFMIGNSVDAVADCTSEGLAVQRGTWGNQDVQAPYFAVYGISASDSPAYAAAFTKLAESQAGTAPGPMFLFENRAGIHGDTHVVVIGAPTLAGLNQYLDTLFASRAFSDFNGAVDEIRTVTWRSQVFRMNAWTPTPPAN